MTASWEFLKTLDHVEEAIAVFPWMAVRLSREGANCRKMLMACNLALEGQGHAYYVPVDAPHIRRQAKANRKRNKAARQARRANR